MLVSIHKLQRFTHKRYHQLNKSAAISARSPLKILNKISDYTDLAITKEEVAILKARYNEITEDIADHVKLSLTGWQRLASKPLPKDVINNVKCDPRRKSIVLFREFYSGASLITGVTALTYATLLDIFHKALPFATVLTCVAVGGALSGIIACFIKLHNMHNEEIETIAKLQVYREAMAILRVLIALEHELLRHAIENFQNRAEHQRHHAKAQIIPPYLPQEFKRQIEKHHQKNTDLLLKNHLELTQSIPSPKVTYTRIEAVEKTSLYKKSLEYALGKLNRLSSYIINYLGTIAATGGLWGGCMVLKDSLTHTGSWKSPTAILTLGTLMLIAIIMSYLYNRHDTHKADVHQLLIKTQKDFLMLQETYSDAVEASRYMLALNNTYR